MTNFLPSPFCRPLLDFAGSRRESAGMATLTVVFLFCLGGGGLIVNDTQHNKAPDICHKTEPARSPSPPKKRTTKTVGGPSVPWSLRPQNRAAAATCGHARCELPVILRLTQKSLAASDFFCARRSKKPFDFCSGMVASPFAATVVTAILRCDFCAAKLGDPDSSFQAFFLHPLQKFLAKKRTGNI